MFINTLVDILAFLVSLGILVAIHEFGHYIAAKCFGVYVSEYSIGFGPLIFKKKKGETTYSLRALPLGGFCAMAGEGMEENEEFKGLPPERTLQGIKKWKRAIIMIAGVTLNFVLAFFLFVGYFASTPQIDNKATNLIVAKSEKEQFALEKSGYASENILNIRYEYILEKEVEKVSDTLSFDVNNGDSLAKALNGGYFTNQEGTSYYYYPTSANDKKILHITCEGNKEYTVTVESYVSETTGKDDIKYSWKMIGAQRVTYKYNFFGAIGAAFAEVGSSSILILKAFGTLFTKEGINSVGGPIAVFKVSSQASKMGFNYFIYLWGLISVNLGVFNLLPFPGLDGWHFLVIIVEGITKKEMSQKVKGIMSLVGMLILFFLMILITIKDVIGLF